MEYYNNILCISGAKLIRSESNPMGVLSLSNYTNMVAAKKLVRIRRASKESTALIEFDSLPEKYRAMVVKIYPDPRKEAITAPFAQRIKHDQKIKDLFTTYRYDGDKSLKPEPIAKYCNDAAIFDALTPIIDQMTAVRKAGGIRTGKVNNLGTEQLGIWEYALQCVNSVREALPCNMPKTERTLERKYKAFVAGGYYSLIHSGFGNANRVKLDEVGRAVLMELCKEGNKHLAPTIAKAYNAWAVPTGRPAITSRTVIKFMTDNAVDIAMFRDGKAAWANKYDKVIHRERPSAPLMLINADDNDLDLYYTKITEVRNEQTGAIKKITNKYYRPKLYVVMDCAYNYVLGYSYGDAPSIELIKEAFCNAMQHIKEITGSYHGWGQLVTDRWGIGGKGAEKTELRKFFESHSKFTPPPAGQPRSKAIEQSFGSAWHGILKGFSNYAGHNIEAQSKSNSDCIAENIRHNPQPYTQIGADVARFVEALRCREWKETGQSRKELWLADFAAQNVSDRRAMSDETYLMTFGKPHTETNRATNEGIKITINKRKYIYDIPADIYRSVVGRQMQVYYDATDMSRVLATDGVHRFVATANQSMPMALEDMRDGDRDRLNRLLAEKEMHRIEVLDRDISDKALLDRVGIDARSLIQAGVLNKTARQEANKIAMIPPQAIDDAAVNIYSLI